MLFDEVVFLDHSWYEQKGNLSGKDQSLLDGILYFAELEMDEHFCPCYNNSIRTAVLLYFKTGVSFGVTAFERATLNCLWFPQTHNSNFFSLNYKSLSIRSDYNSLFWSKGSFCFILFKYAISSSKHEFSWKVPKFTSPDFSISRISGK